MHVLPFRSAQPVVAGKIANLSLGTGGIEPVCQRVGGLRTFGQLETACRAFCEQVNNRIHHETKRKPAHLLQERHRLYPQPREPFGTTRRVTWNSTISVESIRYSVPNHLIDTRIWARFHGDELTAYAYAGRRIRGAGSRRSGPRHSGSSRPGSRPRGRRSEGPCRSGPLWRGLRVETAGREASHSLDLARTPMRATLAALIGHGFHQDGTAPPVGTPGRSQAATNALTTPMVSTSMGEPVATRARAYKPPMRTLDSLEPSCSTARGEGDSGKHRRAAGDVSAVAEKSMKRPARPWCRRSSRARGCRPGVARVTTYRIVATSSSIDRPRTGPTCPGWHLHLAGRQRPARPSRVRGASGERASDEGTVHQELTGLPRQLRRHRAAGPDLAHERQPARRPRLAGTHRHRRWRNRRMFSPR